MADDPELFPGGLPAAGAAWAQVAEASVKVAAAAPGLWELTDAQLVTILHDEQAAAAQREGARLAVIRELDQRGHAACTGAASTAAWLSHQLLIDPRAAAADVRAARQLDPDGDTPPGPGALQAGTPAGTLALAATGRALLSGDISRAHADTVAAMVRALPSPVSLPQRDDLHARAQGWLLEQCAQFTPTDVRRLGVQLRHTVDPDGVLADERDACARAVFWVKPDVDGISYRFGGTTDPVTGSQLATFVDAHAAPRPRVDDVNGTRVADPRTADQRRGHAFADLVRLAVHADPGVRGGASTHLVVTTTFAGLQARLGERGTPCADTETGQPLSAALTRQLACDTTVIPMVLGAARQPLDVGRATRTIPPAIRRALVARDRHCAFPGCTRPPRWADAHHIQHWADGGPTALDNLVLLCGHHHDLIHHTDWTVRIIDGRPVFARPHDRTVSRARAPS